MMDSSLQKNREFNTLSPNSVKLLASKNISRPQILFTVAPDNSNAPFLPILKTKPNAIVRLEDCDLTADPETGDYTHPYLKELEEFGKCLELYVHVPAASNPVPLPLEETPLIFVDSTVTLESMLMELSSEQEIAVDLEHHSYRTFLGITCLIQLSSRTKDYIVDAIALRDHLGNFNKLFTDPKIVKVLHGSDMDLMWLQRDFGVYIVNLFDTGQAARALQLPRFSLSYLLQHFAGVYTNKAYQLADWRIRPLPEELVTYARTDTHYLLYIAEQLRNHLADRGLLSSVLERSRELCLRIYKKPTFDPLGYLSMPNMLGGVSLNKRQLYALKHLCILRDSIARREDESLNYVLPNHMLRLIAEELPRETTGIFACCSPIPPLVRKYVFDIHKIVLDARNNKLNELVIDDSAAQFKSDRAEQRTERSSVLVPGMLRCPPHDFSNKTSFRLRNISQAQGVSKEPSWNKSSSLGKSFSRVS
uniref:Exosome complex component 10 homolog n=1 Tax=Mesocestoides corti TaxID=53468 RepID=A0A5K3EH92_MESCO